MTKKMTTHLDTRMIEGTLADITANVVVILRDLDLDAEHSTSRVRRMRAVADLLAAFGYEDTSIAARSAAYAIEMSTLTTVLGWESAARRADDWRSLPSPTNAEQLKALRSAANSDRHDQRVSLVLARRYAWDADILDTEATR